MLSSAIGPRHLAVGMVQGLCNSLGIETTKEQGSPSQQEDRGTTGFPPQEKAWPSHSQQSDTHTLGSPATATRPASPVHFRQCKGQTKGG